jgi:hypothetical protein
VDENGPAGGPEDYEVIYVVPGVVEFVPAELPADCVKFVRALQICSTVAPDDGVETAEVIGDKLADALISRRHHDHPPAALTLFRQESEHVMTVGKAARIW